MVMQVRAVAPQRIPHHLLGPLYHSRFLVRRGLIITDMRAERVTPSRLLIARLGGNYLRTG